MRKTPWSSQYLIWLRLTLVSCLFKRAENPPLYVSHEYISMHVIELNGGYVKGILRYTATHLVYIRCTELVWSACTPVTACTHLNI